MRKIERTFIRITRLIVLGLMLGCLCARSTGVAQQSSDPTRPDLIPYRKGENWGFSDASKKLIIPARYDYVERFSEGLVAVELGKRGYIDRNGKEVTPFKYDNAFDFSGGFALVIVNDRWGLIDRSGKEVIPPKYDSVQRFSEGLAEVELKGQRGYVGRNGTEYFEP